jgi:hypothetical protein
LHGYNVGRLNNSTATAATKKISAAATSRDNKIFHYPASSDSKSATR